MTITVFTLLRQQGHHIIYKKNYFSWVTIIKEILTEIKFSLIWLNYNFHGNDHFAVVSFTKHFWLQEIVNNLLKW